MANHNNKGIERELWLNAVVDRWTNKRELSEPFLQL